MLLSLALLVRAVIQHLLREGLRKHDEENPGKKAYAGWKGKLVKSPTHKMFYEHSYNCHFIKEGEGRYRYKWPSHHAKFKADFL